MAGDLASRPESFDIPGRIGLQITPMFGTLPSLGTRRVDVSRNGGPDRRVRTGTAIAKDLP